LAQLEKTTDAARRANEIGAPRITSLQDLSDTYNTDPYELSKRVRKQFREVKKVEKRKREEEEAVKDKYSLPSDLKLIEGSEVQEEAKNLWAKERTEWEASERTKRRRTIAEIGKTTKKDGSLAASLLKNSLKSSDPFLSSKTSSKPTIGGIVRRPRG
jgi:coiled-coil domain-containing protein 130